MITNSRYASIVGIVVMALGITVGFQNCGGKLPDTNVQVNSSSSNGTQPETVTLTDTTNVPTLALGLTIPKVAMNAGEVQVVEGTGGTKPYSYMIVSGPATIVASNGTLTAGSTSGSAVVRVSDAAGSKLDRTITVTAAAVTPPPPTITPGSVSFTSPGTYAFTIPTYAKLNVDVRGAGGGGGGSNIDAYGGSAGANGGNSSAIGIAAAGGAGGQGSNYYFGVNYYPDASAAPSGNGGGGAGGAGPVYGYTKGQNGGAGAQVTYQFLANSGGPGIGTVVTIVVGAGGAGGYNGTYGFFGAGGTGASGAVYISWGP